MSRPIKIGLFGLLGGIAALAIVRNQHLQGAGIAVAFVGGFVIVALLAIFATKEKRG